MGSVVLCASVAAIMSSTDSLLIAVSQVVTLYANKPRFQALPHSHTLRDGTLDLATCARSSKKRCNRKKTFCILNRPLLSGSGGESSFLVSGAVATQLPKGWRVIPPPW